MKRRLSGSIVVLALLWCAPASAQSVTTTEGLSLDGTVQKLTVPVGAAVAGQALSFATALEVATTPVGAMSSGFATKLDPSTGLKVRKATTFGPAFAERALTSGEGSVSMGASFRATTYTELGSLKIDNLPLASVSTPVAATTKTATGSFAITSKTLMLGAVMGVTDNFDVGVSVPLVDIAVSGTATQVNGSGQFTVGTAGNAESSGIGDIAALAKYRFVTFGKDAQPDPGGVAFAVVLHMPTGDRQQFRGLGRTRTAVSLVFSSGQGRLRPHANAGFEVWNKSVDTVTDFTTNTTARARHQVLYAAGLEFEAAPKLTLLIDVVGQNVLSAGRVDYQGVQPPPGASAASSLVTLSDGLRKILLTPGLKVNLKSKMLLSLSGLTTLSDDGLHAHFTPVVAIDISM